MKIKTFSVAIIIVLIAIAAIIAYFVVVPWATIALGISLMPNPPKPEITYGEFPFRLVYEINGQQKVVQDTLICEYAGIGMNEGRGKYREWKERLASGNQKILLLNTNGASGIVFRKQKTLKQEIYYDPGPAWYYMGDLERGNGYKHSFPNASFSEEYQDGSGPYGNILADELLEKYKIKLISWDYTQPIKNSFSKNKK
jgi:hypothetical protein